MLSAKLVRSLILGDTISNPLLLPTHANRHSHHHADDDDDDDNDEGTVGGHGHHGRRAKTKTPILVFLPTRELIKDTYRLAAIARDIGMDLYPNASLSHIIFSWSSTAPSPKSSSSSSSSSSCRPSFSSSSTTTSSLWASLPNDAAPLPFPSLSTASVSLLRFFVSLSKGLFKLVFIDCDARLDFEPNNEKFSTWDCSPLSLVSRVWGQRVDSMDGFSRVLAGQGWTLFRTNNKRLSDSGEDPKFSGVNSVYLFRKMDSNRVRARGASGEGRIRELRLPPLDFKNVPLRILQYILLMTDDIFYLA
ncbi:hypothetical protein Nepgr_013232 [Nepenthes gracilis]|uniref:Uncharacterized protein n=1 Tax=Nepenthes gracilis TaxID=150966 RepID=A0AAD3SIM5_NEPGR|nr:hypothetical protein Nepgr_013232 [Nepenthes gracilis]